MLVHGLDGPGVLQDLFRGVALLQGTDHVSDQVFGGLTHLLELRRCSYSLTLEVVLALLNHREDLGVVVAVEGRHAAQQDVQDHAHRPDVAALVVVPLQNLRRDVVRLKLHQVSKFTVPAFVSIDTFCDAGSKILLSPKSSLF